MDESYVKWNKYPSGRKILYGSTCMRTGQIHGDRN
jgi:hypothetical protein